MELVRYDKARQALSEAVAVDEVKQIHDISAAMKAYARQAKDKQLEVDASEIRMRAERRLGEMIRHQKETVGLNTGGGDTSGGSRERPPQDPPTLAEVGISRDLSSRSQAIASIPEEDFEQTLAEHREAQEAIAAKTMHALAKQGEEHQRKETEIESQKPDGSRANNYASIALMQLDNISKSDPNAIKELIRVKCWIEQRIKEYE